MNHNDVLRSLRYMLKVNDAKMAEIMEAHVPGGLLSHGKGWTRAVLLSPDQNLVDWIPGGEGDWEPVIKAEIKLMWSKVDYNRYMNGGALEMTFEERERAVDYTLHYQWPRLKEG